MKHKDDNTQNQLKHTAAELVKKDYKPTLQKHVENKAI